MTRRSKIARLPLDVRNELNRRIENGEEGKDLVAWLNGHPEVKRVLAAKFEGREINEQNLCDWKAGGYLDWVAQQEALEQAHALAGNTGELGAAANRVRPDDLAAVLALRSAAVLAEWNGGVTEEYERKLKALRRLSMVVLALRRSNHQALRMEMELIQIKEGIGDRVRKTYDDEFAFLPPQELYHRLWTLAGQRFGSYGLDAKAEPASDESRAIESKKDEGKRQKEGEQAKNNQQPTTDAQQPEGENEKEQRRKHPTTNNQRRTSNPKKEKDRRDEPQTLNTKPSNLERKGRKPASRQSEPKPGSGEVRGASHKGTLAEPQANGDEHGAEQEQQQPAEPLESSLIKVNQGTQGE